MLATHDRTEPAEDLAALAEHLGHLPLALSQAAAFMADADMTVADYRVLLADRTRTLADASPEALPPGHIRAMAAAWDLSIERAERMHPAGLARSLLRLAAFMDPNGIPAAALTTPPAVTYLAEHRAGTAADTAGDVNPADVTAELRVLHRLSLIDHTARDLHREVRVHALIQRTLRDTLTSEQYAQTARAAADALLAVWPQVERDTVLAQTLRANAATLITWAEPALHRPDVHDVLVQVGHSLGESGQVTAAITYHWRLAATLPTGGGRRGMRQGLRMRSPNCWRTGRGCWALTTRTPSTPAAASPAGGTATPRARPPQAGRPLRETEPATSPGRPGGQPSCGSAMSTTRSAAGSNPSTGCP
ncbi:DUF7779 domain-containing protein [Actinacidiphila acididurans]|uniref:DUF7779 domain-containing protein n=1 Tax=Actinacidiphila acididurans TaxID=2784346 RepID=A0ABS2U1K0_9ACTN|nr:hypothetical protein [Actinacidiphila acididurans]MBM9509460.1 hypothetical protein [Actinacidiphila acididurans]